MTISKFVIWAIAHLGVGDTGLSVQIQDLHDVHPHMLGRTLCNVDVEPMQCVVSLDDDLAKDTRKRRHARWNNRQNVIIHELCHVQTMKKEHASHGRKWKKCMRKNHAWYDENTSY